MEVISRNEKNKKVGTGQHGFTRNKSNLTNLIAFSEELSRSVDLG